VAITNTVGISNPGNPGVTNATSATVVLTDAQANDSLAINGVLPGGITSQITQGAGTITVNLSGTATYAQYQTALHQIVFSTPGDAPNTTDRIIHVSVTDATGTSNQATSTVHVTPVNDAPALTLGPAGGVSYTENAAATALFTTGSVADPDSPATFAGGSYTVAVTAGGEAADRIVVLGSSGFSVSGSSLLFGGDTIGSIGFGAGSATVTALTSFATPAAVNQLVHAFGFQSASENPLTTDRTVHFTFNDGGNTGGGALDSNTVSETVHVTAVNDPPVAQDGTASGNEDNAILGTAVATDVDSPSLTYSLVG
jgi:hypothetical protein